MDNNFDKYLKNSEPSKRSKAYAWSTAIGLQEVDGLKTSKYLIETAKSNIDGEISINEAKERIDSYYKESVVNKNNDTEEADKVSSRIAEILSEPSFIFSAQEYLNIHKRLFDGIYSFAGKVRDYDITKKEWVLDGDTVIYGSKFELIDALEYDIDQERKFSYKNLTMNQVIEHLSAFVSRLWQIHVFGEGNTRTTAVFLIKYLTKLGLDVNDDSFAYNSWYFRNALVRANYSNISKNINETTEYLNLFFRNLLLNETNELKNRYMHIQYSESQKTDIQNTKPYIEIEKTDIHNKILDLKVSNKTKNNIIKLYEKMGLTLIFGRSEVIRILNIKESAASSLIKKMLDLYIIQGVKGLGKGKYKFK